MGPFPTSGKRMEVDFGAVLRVENGKVAEMWVTWDNMAALAQLGHLPTPPGKSEESRF
jgi:predicted ester cyclase